MSVVGRKPLKGRFESHSKQRLSLVLEGRGPKDMDSQGPSRIEKGISRDTG